MRRTLAAILALFYAVLAVWILLGREAWFNSTPGVPQTGPFNSHFVIDVGFAFLAAAAGIAAFAIWPKLWAAALTGAGFPALHGLFHLWLILRGHIPHIAFELSLVVLPAALAVWVGWPRKGDLS